MLKTFALTSLALIAFAANSVLARLALDNAAIDPASFTFLRLVSGTVILFFLIFTIKQKNATNHSQSLFQIATQPQKTAKGSWFSGLMLFIYAACFSMAYVSLDTATGALILFGMVQITMVAISIFNGNKLHISEWAGIILAFFGFIYLILPNLGSPSLYGFMLMAAAGIAWGFYTVKGRGSHLPIADTAFNFLRATPFAFILLAYNFSNIAYSWQGIVYAVLSGAITSGIGYAIWYAALKHLQLTTAAVVQLSVPVIAAAGGVIFVAEPIGLRLTIASLLILGGIALVIFGRKIFRASKAKG